MRLGLIIGVGKDPDGAIRKVHDLGVPTCQVGVDSFEPEMVARLRGALDHYRIEATSLVIGGPGPEEYDFYNGPLTIGFVPCEWRARRIEHAKKASDFAKQCGIAAVQTHCGFIPENPNDPVYKETVVTIREVASYCRHNGQSFRYETGQESKVLDALIELVNKRENSFDWFDAAVLSHQLGQHLAKELKAYLPKKAA